MRTWLVSGSLETITRFLFSFTFFYRTANPAYSGWLSWLHNTSNTFVLHTSILFVDVLTGYDTNVVNVLSWNTVWNREASVLFSPSSEFRISPLWFSIIFYRTTSIASEIGKVSFTLPSFSFYLYLFFACSE